MTKAQVKRILTSNQDASLYLWHGEVYLDDGESARMIAPSILCDLSRAGVISPLDARDASIWVAD